jgi:hypothetical protein
MAATQASNAFLAPYNSGEFGRMIDEAIVEMFITLHLNHPLFIKLAEWIAFDNDMPSDTPLSVLWNIFTSTRCFQKTETKAFQIFVSYKTIGTERERLIIEIISA